jgi:hypothetical protein
MNEKKPGLKKGRYAHGGYRVVVPYGIQQMQQIPVWRSGKLVCSTVVINCIVLYKFSGLLFHLPKISLLKLLW